MSQSLLLSEPQLLNLRIENNSLCHKALCNSKRIKCFYKIKRFLVIFYLKDYILKFKKIIKKILEEKSMKKVNIIHSIVQKLLAS